MDWSNFDFFAWILLPLLIFFARVTDVTIGTLRLIFISRSMKFVAAVLGFFEVIIWLAAIGQIMKNLNNWVTFVAYGLGFATGNYIGILIGEKLSIGKVIVRIITQKPGILLEKSLREHGIGVTTIPAIGARGKVKVLFSIVRKKDLGKVMSIINELNPNAFYTIEDVKYVNEGVFPESAGFLLNRIRFIPFRKGK